MTWALRKRIQGPWPSGPCLWLHGASLGETRMLLGVLQTLKQQWNWNGACLLTTQKSEILEFLQKEAPEFCQVALAPLDVAWARQRFWQKVRPWALVLGESEFWPGWLRQASQAHVPVALVSGRVRRLYPWLNTRALAYVSMQTPYDLAQLQFKNKIPQSCLVEVGGDWMSLTHVGRELSFPTLPRPFSLCLLSVHRQEWRHLRTIILQQCHAQRAVVLAPRRLEELEFFQKRIQGLGLSVVPWPSVQPGGVSVVQAFGCLDAVCRASEKALVGGSFCAVGVHDFWEPLRAGCEVWIGPNRRPHEKILQALHQQKVIHFTQGSRPIPWHGDGLAPLRLAFLHQYYSQIQGSFASFATWLLRQYQATFGA